MLDIRFFLVAVLGSLVSANASAQSIEGMFRGMYVCEKLPTTRNILQAPLDLEVKGDSARFARPLFNLDGSRVVGNELASGTVDASGRLHLTSRWSYLGNTSNAEYSGTVTSTGGTLTGTQTWTGPGGGQPVRRTCTIAVVPAIAKSPSSAQQR
ncbi:MAG TPA: hypothetical protein VFP79_11295 [Pseudolabrys sp.]|nr:hypothetical protein [Pseudolabrys sp.]